jgi:hypothetical protein
MIPAAPAHFSGEPKPMIRDLAVQRNGAIACGSRFNQLPSEDVEAAGTGARGQRFGRDQIGLERAHQAE